MITQDKAFKYNSSITGNNRLCCVRCTAVSAKTSKHSYNAGVPWCLPVDQVIHTASHEDFRTQDQREERV